METDSFSTRYGPSVFDCQLGKTCGRKKTDKKMPRKLYAPVKCRKFVYYKRNGNMTIFNEYKTYTGNSLVNSLSALEIWAVLFELVKIKKDCSTASHPKRVIEGALCHIQFIWNYKKEARGNYKGTF